MRDPNRIDPFLAKLGEAWKKCPDQRFGQFLSNFFGAAGQNVWMTEDDEWLAGLQAFIDGKNPEEAIEDYMDRQAYEEAMDEHRKNPITFTMEDVQKILEDE